MRAALRKRACGSASMRAALRKANLRERLDEGGAQKTNLRERLDEGGAQKGRADEAGARGQDPTERERRLAEASSNTTNSGRVATT